MKAGDLVKWSGWKYPMLIVSVMREPGGIRKGEKYCQCLVGDDYITLFESQLEVVSESR